MNTPTPHNNPHPDSRGDSGRTPTPDSVVPAAPAVAAADGAGTAADNTAPIVGGRYVGSPAFWVAIVISIAMGLYLVVYYDYQPGFVFPTRPLTFATLLIAAGSVYAHLARRWRVVGLAIGLVMMAATHGLFLWLGFQDLSLGIDEPMAAMDAYYDGVANLYLTHPVAMGVYDLLQETSEVWWALAIAGVLALTLRSIATPPPVQYPHALQRVGEKFFTRPTTLGATIVFAVGALVTSVQVAGLSGMMIIHPALAGALGGVVLASLISRSRLITFAVLGLAGLVPLIVQAVLMYPMSPLDPVIYPPALLEPLFQGMFFAGLLGVSALVIRRRSSQPDPFAPHPTGDATDANAGDGAAAAAGAAAGTAAQTGTVTAVPNAPAKDFFKSHALIPTVIATVAMALSIFIGLFLQMMFIPWPLLPPVSAVVLFVAAWWLWRASAKTLRTVIIVTGVFWGLYCAGRGIWFLHRAFYFAYLAGVDLAVEGVFHITQGLLFAALVVVWCRINRPETSALEGANTSGTPVGTTTNTTNPGERTPTTQAPTAQEPTTGQNS